MARCAAKDPPTFWRKSTPPDDPAAGALLETEGAYCDVTVLFADIESFTAMAERLPPRAVVSLLNEYFSAMTDVVVAHGGVLDKYIGDAMMVVWENEPALGACQAARCALAMHRTLSGLQEKWLEEGKLPMKIRIGIASGRVIVGQIGSKIRCDRTVIGDAVNTAARLEALNKEYHTDVIMSQSTYDLVKDFAQVRSIGIVQIKGRFEPLGLYALTGWDER